MSLQGDETLMKVLEDTEPPLNGPLAAKYKRSFAFPSMNERVPVIITKIIDFLVRDKKNIIQNYGEDVCGKVRERVPNVSRLKRKLLQFHIELLVQYIFPLLRHHQNAEEELKAVIGEISQLKNHLQTAKCFLEFTSDSPDTELWNTELRRRQANADPLNYYESDWLFAECYLYRRIREFFATKQILNSHDPFSYQKDTVLAQSVKDLGPHLKRLFDERILDCNFQLSPGDIKANLAYMIKCSLWANRMDLSLSGGDTSLGLNIIDQVKHWDENILVDDTEDVSSVIIGKDVEAIDIVTDNGGIELITDLFLADYLITRCGVGKVRFRVKPMPWYVSDVTPSDFHATLDNIASYSSEHYKFFANRWLKFVDTGSWELTSECYWCLGLSYSEMPRADPSLFADLKSSPLVIFKGDLNYRKLVQDRNWEPTKPFSEGLGHFVPVRLLALRTCKADTIVGLKPGVAEKVASRSENWLVSGEYGLIQFNSGC